MEIRGREAENVEKRGWSRRSRKSQKPHAFKHRKHGPPRA
jgi:hypothetical protein